MAHEDHPLLGTSFLALILAVRAVQVHTRTRAVRRSGRVSRIATECYTSDVWRINQKNSPGRTALITSGASGIDLVTADLLARRRLPNGPAACGLPTLSPAGCWRRQVVSFPVVLLLALCSR